MNFDKIYQTEGIYYLRIIPSLTISDEMLINAIKSWLNAFWLPETWFWLETYFLQSWGTKFVESYVFSNTQEGLVYMINFFDKLYEWRVQFSIKVHHKLIEKQNYPKKYRIWLDRHGVFQIRKLGAIAWISFYSSPSIPAEIIKELDSFINDNEIIKMTFSFTKGEYSQLVKYLLYEYEKKWMSEEDIESFEKSFTDSQNMFSFMWSIEHNLKYNISEIVQKNLSLYSSCYNHYSLKEMKGIWTTIPSWKQLLQPEALLSNGLFIPVISPHAQTQNYPIVMPKNEFVRDGFIKPFIQY